MVVEAKFGASYFLTRQGIKVRSKHSIFLKIFVNNNRDVLLIVSFTSGLKWFGWKQQISLNQSFSHQTFRDVTAIINLFPFVVSRNPLFSSNWNPKN